MKEYVQKIVEIGKKGFCEKEDLKYFISNLPDIGNKKLLHFLKVEYEIYTFHISRSEFFSMNLIFNLGNKSKKDKFLINFIENFIKGVHLIEIKKGGFGSTTMIYNLFYSLIEKDKNKAIELYNWIAFNGGNYYIPKNISFEEAKKAEDIRRQIKRRNELEVERVHKEAVLRKKENREIHILNSNKKKEEREKEIERLKGMNEMQYFKEIINSDYPLDFYPELFSEIEVDLIKELSSEEILKFKEKLKK